MVKQNLLEHQIGFVETHLDRLWHQTNPWPVKRPELTLQEFTSFSVTLEDTLEELRVLAEELDQQSEYLTTAYQILATERQRYQDLFDFIPDGVVVTDWKGLIQSTNRAAAELFSVRQDFLVGKPLAIYVHTQDQQCFWTQISRLTAFPQLQRWQIRLNTRDRDPFPAEVTVAGIWDPQGKLTGLRWLIRDITLTKQLEALLQQALE